MIHQQLKDFLFYTGYLISWPCYLLARLNYATRATKRNTFALHLGSGPKYIDGMVNIDGNLMRKFDLWHDLRRRLPFPDGSVHFIYTCHTLEHLYPNYASKLLEEMNRVLTADGEARIVVPSLEHALTIASGDATSQWPRSFYGSRAQAINYLFCDGQHKYGYSLDLLAELSAAAGLKVSSWSGPLELDRPGYNYKGYGLPREPEGSLVVDLCRSGD